MGRRLRHCLRRLAHAGEAKPVIEAAPTQEQVQRINAHDQLEMAAPETTLALAKEGAWTGAFALDPTPSPSSSSARSVDGSMMAE
jgi:hypothetical protein